jgi:hypothetical protein
LIAVANGTATTAFRPVPESQVGCAGDLLFFGYQALLAGSIGGDVTVAGFGLDIQGRIDGNVKAEVGPADQVPLFSPMQFVPGMSAVPAVEGGLTIGEGAEIGGDLECASIWTATERTGDMRSCSQELMRRIARLARRSARWIAIPPRDASVLPGRAVCRESAAQVL